jgi:hypothetical protein
VLASIDPPRKRDGAGIYPRNARGGRSKFL